MPRGRRERVEDAEADAPEAAPAMETRRGAREGAPTTTTVHAPDAIQRPASPTTASRRKARVIDELWEVLERAEAGEARVRAYHELAVAVESEENSFEQEAGSEPSTSRWPRAGLKMIEKLPFRNQWRDLVVERAVGDKMYTCTLGEQAGALRVLRAAGLGCRTRTNVNHILPYDDATRDLYWTNLSELAFDGRAYAHSVESRANNERLRGPTPELDARRLKTYSTGAFASLLVTYTMANDAIRNGIMESLLKPLVLLICKGGEGAPAWEVDHRDNVALAQAAADDCESGFEARDVESLHYILMKSRLMCLGGIGDYVECFGEALQNGVLELSLRLVAGPGEKGWPNKLAFCRRHGLPGHLPGDPQLSEALSVVGAFVAHRKFAVSFIEHGGAKLLTDVPCGPMSYFNLTRCMFGIASITTALEKLVSPPSNLARRFVKIALELLDCSNEFARRHAALFLTFAVQFPIVVVAFDAESGLKLVLNTLRTTAHIVSDKDGIRSQMTRDELLMAKETGDHVSLLLRQYMRAHFVQHVKAIEEKVSGRSKKSGANETKMSKSKESRAILQAIDIGHDATEKLFSLVSRHKRIAAIMQTKSWLVIDAFVAQGGPKVMLDLLTLAPGEKTLRECVLGSLSVLKLVTLHPNGRVATATARTTQLGFDEDYSSGYVLIDIIESAAEAVDTEAVVEALKVTCNLVSAPHVLLKAENKSAKERSANAGKLQRSHSVEGKSMPIFDYGRMEETFLVGRKHVEQARGVKGLLNLLFRTSKTLPQPSMNITRALCCRALHGLSRDISIANTLQTLEIARHLSELIRDTGHAQPFSLDHALVDSKSENGTGSAAAIRAAAAEFHRCAVELIATTAGFTNIKAVTPAMASDAAAPPLAKLQRHLIATATKVRYPHEELLQLMHEHLVASGLNTTAASLLDEAGLLRTGRHDAAGGAPNEASPRLKLNFKGKPLRNKIHRRAPRSLMTGAARGLLGKVNEPFTLGIDQGPSCALNRELSGEARAVTDRSREPSTRGIKRKSIGEELRKSFVTPPLTKEETTTTSCVHGYHTPSPAAKEIVRKEYPTPGVLVSDAPRGETGCGVRSRLDSIMTQYLRAQHKQCAAPITACAPFSLLAPHQCPTPIRALKFPTNLTARLRRREWANAPGWFDGARRADRHFVYSRFRPLRTIRAGTEIHNAFTAVSFLHGVSDQIVIGTNSGEIRMYDTNNSDVLEVSGGALAGAVRKIAPTGAGAPQPIFAVTSDASCSIWSLPNPEEAPVILYEDEDAFGCALNSVGSQFVIGSVDGVDIIDMETQVSARRLASKMDGPASLTKKNDDVSFSPNDGLLLWDETLWDLRLPEDVPVRCFDRFSEVAGACFHPNGNEIIIGREVWDVRSSRLLRTVPSFDRAALKFNPTGTVALAHILHPRHRSPRSSLERCHHPYKHSFCTVDVTDYSDICTVDVAHGMMNAAWGVDSDTICATVEYDIADTLESSVRVHEVGRLRPTEDESDVEEDHADVAYEEDRDAGFDLGPLGPPDVRLGRRDGDGDGDGDGDDAPLDVDDARIAHQIATLRQLAGMRDDGDIEWVGRVDDDEYSSEYDSDFIDSDDDDDDEYDDEYDSDFIDSDEDEDEDDDDEDEDEAARGAFRGAGRRHLLQQVAANARALVREEMNRRYATIDRDRDADDDQDRDGSDSGSGSGSGSSEWETDDA